jgi:predicted PurR-regulated permease PerM
MESKKLELVAFSSFFIVLSVLTFFVFQPFLGILVLAAVMSILLHPLYEKLTKLLHGGRSLAACFFVIIALFFLIIPILFLGLQIFGQAQSFFTLTQTGQGEFMQGVQQNINVLIQHTLPGATFNLSDLLNSAMTFLSSNFGGFLSQTTYVFFQIFFLLFSFFFLLRDGDKMLEGFISLSPFDKEQSKEVFSSVYRTISSVIRGTLFVGLVRFVLLTIAFYLLGIPHALLWSMIGGIVGTVPGLGTPFVVVPAFFYLLLTGHVVFAIGMASFGVLLIFFIDNMLSAYFFGKGLDVSPIFVLFSILGGILFFGPLGFIFGPIILSLFISAIDMYRILVLKKA